MEREISDSIIDTLLMIFNLLKIELILRYISCNKSRKLIILLGIKFLYKSVFVTPELALQPLPGLLPLELPA